MSFDEYLQKALDEDVELKKEFDALQPEYEVIEKLIKARLDSNLTQQELARKCGLKQSNISRLESGRGNPTIKLLKKVADSLDYDLVVEFRKRQPATESSMAPAQAGTVKLNVDMGNYSDQGTTQNMNTWPASQKMTLVTI